MIDPSHSSAAQIPPEVARAHAELMTHRDLQFDFPKFEPPVTPQWLIELAKFLEKIWPHLKYAVWAGLILVAAIILYYVVRELDRRNWLRRKRDGKAPEPPPEWRPAPEAARNLLRDADAMADEGRFDKAAHLLLLRSIEHINEQRPDLVRPALTSREIGTLGPLPTASRGAFMSMARVVERVLFAGREIGASDFAQCREAYERFAFPGHWVVLGP